MKKNTFYIFAILFLLNVPLAVFAVSIPNPIEGVDSFGQIMGNVIRGFLGIVGAVAVALIVWGGFRYMISRGSEQEIEYAKNTLLYAIVGLFIVAVSYIIVDFLITAISPTGP